MIESEKDFYAIYIPKDDLETQKEKWLYKRYGLTNSDKRISSKSIGALGAGFISIIVTVIVIGDIPILYRHIRIMMIPNLRDLANMVLRRN